MPIRGLTDKPASFPEIGRVRKGAPKTEEGWVGQDLTYFRVEFDEREIESIGVFRSKYGDQPTELNVLLPFNSVNENFEAWREAYVKGGMTHRCDGEQVLFEINPATGEVIIANGMPYKTCDLKRCKPTGRLKVIIPELQRFAFLTVLTTSYHDIINLSRQLDALLQINGQLAGVPLKLRRRPKEISTPGKDGKRARRMKYLLSIEADPEWVKRKIGAMKRAALPDNGLDEGDYPQLETPEWVDDDDLIEGTILEETVKEKVEENENGKPAPRPFDPETLHTKLQAKGDLHAKAGLDKITKKKRNEMVAALKEVFAGPFADEQTEMFLDWVWNCGSEHDLIHPAQVQATLDWLKLTSDDGGAIVVDKTARIEADLAMTHIAEQKDG